MHGYDLPDTSINNGISNSWFSRINNNKSFTSFIKLFYELLVYIRARDYIMNSI